MDMTAEKGLFLPGYPFPFGLCDGTALHGWLYRSLLCKGESMGEKNESSRHAQCVPTLAGPRPFIFSRPCPSSGRAKLFHLAFKVFTLD